MKSKNRIGIDARMYGPTGKGLGRYTQEVVDNILKLDTENEYVIFLSKENFDNFKTQNANVKKVLADIQWYSVKEQLFMPFLIWREKIDLMHFPHFNIPILTPTKFVVTIHDLILTKFPTVRASTLYPIYYKFKHFIYQIVIKVAVLRAKKIITVSNFSKNDIVDKLKISSDKIVVTYEGVSNLEEKASKIKDDKKVLLSYNIKKDFVVYIGNAYPHKNLEWLVKVFKEKVKGLDLVLVGRKDFFQDRIREYAKKIDFIDSADRVIFPGYVPDEDLSVLYRNAVVYVFPSLYEGFGLPPLEAMSNSCPVLSSNQASMPEILGDAALYFNPDNTKDFVEKLDLICEKNELRQELIKKGHKKVIQYSWIECAKKTLKIYKCFLKK